MALHPQKPLRFIRDGEVGGREFFISDTYSLHCHHQNDCIKVGRCVSHFNVSLFVWAKSQDSVLKPRCLKRKESRTARPHRLTGMGTPIPYTRSERENCLASQRTVHASTMPRQASSNSDERIQRTPHTVRLK